MRRPDLEDLERALREFHASQPASDGDAAALYERRIAHSLEDVVKRERESGPALRATATRWLSAFLGREAPLGALEAELCGQLASGALDESVPGLMQHLRAQVQAQLAIDNPRYWSLEAAKARAARLGSAASHDRPARP
ncbi:MAG: DUF6285 domain-containing protein [Steroidobacteraceae bacterium]|jgi:hypothetical protein